MADMMLLQKNLIKNGFKVTYFASVCEAVNYMDAQIDGKTVGIGGSMSVLQMGVADRLRKHNTLHWSWTSDGEGQKGSASTDIYISSVNAAAQTGELVNIDRSCNRIASGLYGHKKVYFVIGNNKVTSDVSAAINRAKNVAAPKNARRMGVNTPCAIRGDRCYDCDSPERICCAMVLYWRKPAAMDFEIVLIDEELGY